MLAMTDYSGPALAELHAWHAHQNPLVRALVVPMVELFTVHVTRMQAVIDEQAATIPVLIEEIRTQFTTAQQGLVAQVEALQVAHAVALRAANDRADAVQQFATEQIALLQAAHAAAMQAAKESADATLEAVKRAHAAEVHALKAEHAVTLQVTTDRIDQLERRIYGPRGEKRPKTPDGQREARKRSRAKLTDEEKEAQRKAAAAERQARLDLLRTEILDLPVSDVPAGRPLPPLESIMYEWRPGELFRIRVRREQRVLDDGAIVTAAPAPEQVVEGGAYGPRLHAKVAMDKVLNAMPLRRQERAFERLGAPLPVSTLCALFHRAASLIEPVYKALVALVGSSENVQADETPQPVLDEDHVRRAWMWVFATDNAIVFAYSPSRGGSVPDEILGGTKGTLTVDGHTGYNIVTQAGGRERGGCWSHGRRGLFEARGYAEALVDDLLSDIGELFYVEQLAMEQEIVGTAAHLDLRRSRSAPVIDRIYQTIELHIAKFEPRSSLAKALQYLLNQRAPLTLFLTNARVPLHNNLSERALRVVALLRKNAYFVGHDEAGRSLAMLLSVAATCQLHGVDPEVWLADVIIRAGERGSTVAELLPWEWKTGRGARLEDRGGRKMLDSS